MPTVMESLDSIHAKTRKAYNLVAHKYHELFHDELRGKEYDRRLLDAFAARFDTDSIVCDAGCGPSGHIGRYLAERGLQIVGVDISDACVERARRLNPGLRFERADIARMPFDDGTFDGIISYYSVIDTPRIHVGGIFEEFYRVLKPGGSLLVAVKAGTTEGYLSNLLGIRTEIYLTLFTEQEIREYFQFSGFVVEFLETRKPYAFEIENERIYAIGTKS